MRLLHCQTQLTFSDYAGIAAAIEEGKKNKDQPTLIRMRTTIGFGSKQQGGHDVHGAPLKKDDIAQLKTKFGFNPEETFAVPKEITEYYGKLAEEGAKLNAEWDALFKSYQDKYPQEAAEFSRRVEGRLPEGWEKALPTYTTEDAAVGSRKLSETTLNKLAAVLPELIGGS